MEVKMNTVTYTQLNKDNAYWPEKIVSGNQDGGGHTSGLLSYKAEGRVQRNIIVDAGLGTIEALCEKDPPFDWDAPLDFLITHGHPDHHLELVILSELYCKRMGKKKEKPVSVYCTRDTYEKRLKPVHRYGFSPNGGNTLRFRALNPIRLGYLNAPAVNLGPFHIHAVEVDHFSGAVIFVVEFDEHKILIGWDLRTLPDPDSFSILKGASLALIEANTLSSSSSSGHTSAEELVRTGFLQKLGVTKNVNRAQYGIYFVHFGGRKDEKDQKCLCDKKFFEKIKKNLGSPAGCSGMAERLQSWLFEIK
jgi:ribonuclease BN (tRNA processing enzyme)